MIFLDWVGSSEYYNKTSFFTACLQQYLNETANLNTNAIA